MASISSNTIMCNGLSSPNYMVSSLASLNNFLIFSSLSPTNLLIISGPFTILSSLALSTLANYLAINVFPVPGGPYSSTPLTCEIPYFFKKLGGNLLEANALLKILASSLSKPPIPISSNLKSDLNKF